MLQTASVKVKAQAQSHYENCRLLFDNCSQLSYISPELCEKLNLQSIGTREIVIRTFGNQCSTETLNKVKLSVRIVILT